MSTLRSTLDELRSEDLDYLTDEVLEADFVELERVCRALAVERHRRLAEIHRRETWRRDGLFSTAAWLVSRLRMGWSSAARRVREADALMDMPAASEALSEGDVSEDAVALLMRAREADAAEFALAEEVLVDAARSLPVAELRRAVAYWRAPLDGPAALREAEDAFRARRLYLSTTLGGMVRVDGDLDPETGQTVLAAVEAVIGADGRHLKEDDDRTPAQRRVDALGEVCRQWLDGADRPLVGGERPHVALTVDLEAMEGRLGFRCEFEGGGVVHPEVARRLACDASLSRIITSGRSEPLDVGRRTAVVPAPLRRAVVLRDGHCRFPWCDRPPRWCDAHHVRHWADGGETSLDNLVLLCRRHHRLVHRPGGFRLEMAEGQPVFQRSDGSLLEDRAPP